jgi:hypothetical protein
MRSTKTPPPVPRSEGVPRKRVVMHSPGTLHDGASVRCEQAAHEL